MSIRAIFLSNKDNVILVVVILVLTDVLFLPMRDTAFMDVCLFFVGSLQSHCCVLEIKRLAGMKVPVPLAA